MQDVYGIITDKARALLADGTVNRVLGWKKGEFAHDPTPALLKEEELEELVYNRFCASNLSKYLIEETRKDGRVLVLLKPCDTYGFNQLIKEHRIKRDRVYALGVACRGMLDVNKLRSLGIKRFSQVEECDGRLNFQTSKGEKTVSPEAVFLEKCLSCKGMEHRAYDGLALFGEAEEGREEAACNAESAGAFESALAGSFDSAFTGAAREKAFEGVSAVEALSSGRRFAFWQGELSRCIRCNACRNVCPLCSCVQCVFDNEKSGVASKANTDASEENLFHIIRAFHVAGRCTDCGECSRACPQGIPLHLINRKVIKDINTFYGDYQAGWDPEEPGPLTSFKKEDPEPGVRLGKGGEG